MAHAIHSSWPSRAEMQIGRAFRRPGGPWVTVGLVLISRDVQDLGVIRQGCKRYHKQAPVTHEGSARDTLVMLTYAIPLRSFIEGNWSNL